jgi:hypothetical protein
MKTYKGEKYIYLLMGYQLAKQNKNSVSIGEDDGMKGGQNFWRNFEIVNHKGETILIETKTTSNSANFTRSFVVRDYGNQTPVIKEHIENGENYSTNWIH